MTFAGMKGACVLPLRSRMRPETDPRDSVSRRAVHAVEERENRRDRTVHFRWDFLIDIQAAQDLNPRRVFPHAVCYVYSSAAAVSADEASGWSPYLVWMRACWQGRVADVRTELDQWQARLGESPPGEAAPAEARRDPRRVVAPARSDLGNNRDRMAYPRYRRAGLPTTSSLVESLVGEVNARVKSKQKHWNRPAGAESILQRRAAVLSQDDRLPRFFAQRHGCPFRKRDTLSHESEDAPAQTAA